MGKRSPDHSQRIRGGNNRIRRIRTRRRTRL
jgi:hypothetical protein